jgi:hypothetical protein
VPTACSRRAEPFPPSSPRRGDRREHAALVRPARPQGWAECLIDNPWLLLRARQRALFEYGALATAYTREFDAKWAHGGPPPAEPLLGSADIQSLADLANSFDRVRSMRMVPCTVQQALLLSIAAALPIAPLILTILPLDELLIRTVKSFIAID